MGTNCGIDKDWCTVRNIMNMEQFDLTFTPRKKFKETYRIRTNRLKDWDYTSEGMYFITICTKGKVRWFGEIEKGIMKYSDIGLIVKEEWSKNEEVRKNISLDAFIVMPNHIHGIIHVKERISKPVGNESNSFVETPRRGVSTTDEKNLAESKKRPLNWHKNSIGSIINQFKSISTKQIRKIDPDFHWQSRFHDRLIRSKAELQNVQKYIRESVANWEKDSEFAHSVQPASV